MSLNNARTQYTFSQLVEKELNSLPEKQLQTWLDDAEKNQIRDYNACCIATSDNTGKVSARYVLLRQLDQQGLVFYSNKNSQKGQQIAQNPQGQILFFWRELNRQVRVHGTLVELDRKAVDKYFQSRPLGNQQSTAASEQSQPIESREKLEQQFALFEQLYPAKVPTPETWTGYRLEPNYWEFWQGRVNRLHDRLCYILNKKTSQWQIQRLQP